MVLVLSVLRCPDQAVPEQRRVPGGEYVMGRGAECDWPLMDPDRVLSKRHCAVEYFSGGWQVRDLSTNGTFVNSSGDPVGRDQTRALRDGDRLRLGSYEIECRVEEEAAWGAGQWQSASATPDPMGAHAAPSDDIFSAPLPGLSPAGGPQGGGAPLLPSDFDPLGDEDLAPSMPDHRPSTNDVFTPPRAMMPDLLPDDWNAPTPQAAPTRPVADPFAGLPDPFADLPPAGRAPPPAAPDPFLADPFAAPSPPRGGGLPDPFADLQAPKAPAAPPLPDPFADMAPPAAPVARPPAPVAPPPGDPFADLTPPPAPRADPFAEPGDPFGAMAAPRAPAPPVADPFAEAGDRPPVAPPPPPVMAAVPAAAGSLDQALALLLNAAGLPPPPPGTDAGAALTAAGVALRASVGGLRALLIARADVKREFRIEQTMLRAAGNNPVKFAATDEMAVQALLGPRGNGPAAVQETVDDLTAHQVATVAATQAAARALLAKLAPAGLETDVQGGGIMPGAREKRLWEAYRKLHQQVTDQFEDDFDSAFGKAFARAYEDASRAGKG
ncbi:type VI secretion system-associated FHA domain protein TagH [Humitalea sp. 24SJ18S-53]|uniref:type VI secretion system-associated FHA domain protein TagH n=1 Tax=Humitalea sp. 24SJ18S-53 TaxID=3422307 RepID=UPI003D66FB14